MLPTTAYCPSVSIVAHEEEGFALFHLFHLFKVVSGSFHPVRLVPGRSTFYKRRLHTQLDLQIYYKSTSCYILLQSGESIITKWGSFHVLQIGTSAITK